MHALISNKVQGTEAVRLSEGIALSFFADAVALLLYREPLAFDTAESPSAAARFAEPLRTVCSREATRNWGTDIAQSLSLS